MTAVLQSTEVRVPDIGDFNNIPVIEVLVKPGSVVAAGDPIVTLESDKATLDVPAPMPGRVVTVEVVVGSRVSCGGLLLTLSTELANTSVSELAALPMTKPGGDLIVNSSRAEIAIAQPTATASDEPSPSDGVNARGSQNVYASPSVHRVGRELGVDLIEVKGSGRGGRILKEDVHRWVRERLQSAAAQTSCGPGWPVLPVVDFAKFGEIERQQLSRIRRISGLALARNWATIPHVTNFDEADITELEQFRVSLNEESRGETKITMLSFLVKACASALRRMPAFNASLDGQDIILKKYIHIGVAVDTPAGLLVPVLRNADQLGLRDIAGGLAAKAALARDGKLKREDMEGGCFSISSLGGIGGGAFTPIINAPEIAILGAGKAKIQARWECDQFVPRLILPLSLSWDHRALDGALVARFLSHLVALLQDFRRVSL